MKDIHPLKSSTSRGKEIRKTTITVRESVLLKEFTGDDWNSKPVKDLKSRYLGVVWDVCECEAPFSLRFVALR